MIRCIAIDDEPLALMQITGYIRKTPFLELKGDFENALPAIEFLQNNPVDLMFVDINMPYMNGIDFVKTLKEPPMIVFITAYSEYAIEGFRVNAIDYLLKPVGYTDFLKTANKTRIFFEKKLHDNEKTEEKKEYLYLKADSKLVRIRMDDILFIEGMRDYVRIHIENDKPLMSLTSMHLIEKQLPSDKFMRVHRSYLVNLEKIVTIDHFRIVFEGKIYIPVSEQYKTTFQAYLSSHSLG